MEAPTFFRFCHDMARSAWDVWKKKIAYWKPWNAAVGWGLKYQIKLNSQQKKVLRDHLMESNWVFLDVCPISNHIQITSAKSGALSSINCCSLSFNSSTLAWHHPARCESTQLAGRAGEIWKQKSSSHVWLNWSQRVHYVLLCIWPNSNILPT